MIERIRHTDRDAFLDLALLLIVGIVGVAVFFAKASAGTEARSVLEGLEFLISIGFGWVLQRLYSRRQFEDDLKRYAYSAYRRISDIRKSVLRLESLVERHSEILPRECVQILESFSVLADDMKDTVHSSVADWAEIIGEEIQKAEKLRELETEKHTSRDDRDMNSSKELKIKAVEEEISRLRADLPLYLQLAVEGQEEILPRGGRTSAHARDHFDYSLRANGSITLELDPMIDLNDEEVLEIVQSNSPYFVWEDAAMGTSHLVVIDIGGNHVGEVVNTFEKSGVYHRDYHSTLFQYLPDVEPLSALDGMPGSRLPNSRIDRVDPDEGKIFISFIPELAEGDVRAP